MRLEFFSIQLLQRLCGSNYTPYFSLDVDKINPYQDVGYSKFPPTFISFGQMLAESISQASRHKITESSVFQCLENLQMSATLLVGKSQDEVKNIVRDSLNSEEERSVFDEIDRIFSARKFIYQGQWIFLDSFFQTLGSAVFTGDKNFLGYHLQNIGYQKDENGNYQLIKIACGSSQLLLSTGHQKEEHSSTLLTKNIEKTTGHIFRLYSTARDRVISYLPFVLGNIEETYNNAWDALSTVCQEAGVADNPLGDNQHFPKMKELAQQRCTLLKNSLINEVYNNKSLLDLKIPNGPHAGKCLKEIPSIMQGVIDKSCAAAKAYQLAPHSGNGAKFYRCGKINLPYLVSIKKHESGKEIFETYLLCKILSGRGQSMAIGGGVIYRKLQPDLDPTDLQKAWQFSKDCIEKSSSDELLLPLLADKKSEQDLLIKVDEAPPLFNECITQYSRPENSEYVTATLGILTSETLPPHTVSVQKFQQGARDLHIVSTQNRRKSNKIITAEYQRETFAKLINQLSPQEKKDIARALWISFILGDESTHVAQFIRVKNNSYRINGGAAGRREGKRHRSGKLNPWHTSKEYASLLSKRLGRDFMDFWLADPDIAEAYQTYCQTSTQLTVPEKTQWIHHYIQTLTALIICEKSPAITIKKIAKERSLQLPSGASLETKMTHMAQQSFDCLQGRLLAASQITPKADARSFFTRITQSLFAIIKFIAKWCTPKSKAPPLPRMDLPHHHSPLERTGQSLGQVSVSLDTQPFTVIDERATTTCTPRSYLDKKLRH